jgi:low affinity Fe/Cu permease
VNRRPYIVGFGVDEILGFLAGLFGSVMGFVATVAVMFIWAGSDPLPDTDARRGHAASVSLWSGLGCALPAILILLLFVMGALLLSPQMFVRGPWLEAARGAVYR